mmetsp:Transcript_30393/g.51196  ORF Transcript_30393/g.51196 Transcript_30393/m.51196 type:complete len:342 (-) Transcript_30393:451-1476(-)|eukprot:CAMPEP_0198210408 /NCGR_PEP_ID=MMETSP1445-20131203/20091_1 /TAXON_ID=36898 /ORGANISM="Pyramimonas sp., Strain CCMP2087" /LENGTH=341 /DNA_ID=CAMNT_0043884469 /DNA_START=153 /DNA_END=1178 /DNA_ORIENTATION=-
MSPFKEAFLAKIKELDIETETLEHDAAPTVEQHSKHVGHLPYGQAKNLCLRDKKGNMYLICALKDTATGLKEISERLGVPKSTPVRLADGTKMTEALQVEPGCVTPFAVMNPSAINVRLLLDVKFKDCPKLMFHPFINTATTCITPADFDKFLLAVGRTPEYVDFAATTSLQTVVAGNGPAAPASPAAASPKPAKEPKKEKPRQEPRKSQDGSKREARKSEDASRPTPVAEDDPSAATAGLIRRTTSGPAVHVTGRAPELSSDQWATGQFGRPAGKLETKKWSSTMYTMPTGWEDEPEYLVAAAAALQLNSPEKDSCGREAGDLKSVPWGGSIFSKPDGWA